MRSRLPVPIISLAVLLCSMLLCSAYSQQNETSTKDQEILLIQQLIQNHDLQKARLKLTETAKLYPTDADFDNLLSIVEAQQGDYNAAEKSFRRAITKTPRFTETYL